MKTNKDDNRIQTVYKPSTNELDEILKELISTSEVGKNKEGERYTIYNTVTTKQQINKWALEKCLKVIGEKIQVKTDIKYSNSQLDDISAYNIQIEEQREKARKEFE